MAKILSLYDGMSCGMLAMMSAGINVSDYDAFEIDRYAIQTSQHNFPNIRHHGDVTTADFTQFKDVDYLIGGSPCTYWSIAQSPDKRETTASGIGWELFSHYVRALHEIKPKCFIYENNYSMSSAIRDSINDAFGFEPIMINSALVSAQNRQRLYWVGIRNDDGSYSQVDIEQPQDKGIILKDILENGSDSLTDKSYCITASEYKDDSVIHSLTKHIRTKVAEPINITEDGKSQTIKAQYQKNNENNICCYTSTYGASGVAEPVGMREVGRRLNENGHRADNDKSIEAVQRFEINENPQKANTLTTVQKDNQICEPVRVGALPRPNGELSTSQALRVYSVEGKSVNLTSGGGGMGGKTGLYAITTNKPVYEVKDGQITIKGKQYPIKLKDGYYIIRKLTVTECKRLQTVPEWYEFPVSASQAYKMLGNGWTVQVIAHLIKACERGEIAPKQLSFF